MKILHCCLASFYIDNYGYQENILTKIHKLQGFDVMIVASTESLNREKGLVYLPSSSYVTPDGIPIVRLPYVSIFSKAISRKLRIYKGISKVLESFAPDIIFMHDGQTAAVYPIVKYIHKHPCVKLYIDSHTDEVNSARSWISKNILHRIIYRMYVHHTIPHTQKYYGTLPARVDFYVNYYGTPKEKTDFLPMGINDMEIDFGKRDIVRKQLREKWGIAPDDFVIVTGGKIDERKNIHILLEALSNIKSAKVKLLLFGSVTDNVKEQIDSFISSDKRIAYAGWISASETYKYFFAADLACFPGTHSTLWEECVGYGIPAIFKRWKGITHVDRGGNCIMLEDVNTQKLFHILNRIITDENLYTFLKEKARSQDVMDFFLYSKIALKAIENGK